MSAAWALAGRTAARGARRLAGELGGGSGSRPEYSWISRCLASAPLRSSAAPSEAERGNQQRGTHRENEEGTGLCQEPEPTLEARDSSRYRGETEARNEGLISPG